MNKFLVTVHCEVEAENITEATSRVIHSLDAGRYQTGNTFSCVIPKVEMLSHNASSENPK